MSAQPTPGRWVAVYDFRCHNGERTVGVKSAATGSAVAWPSGRNELEEMANAKLIAAAPELFAALRDILRIAKAASIGVTGNTARIALAEAAIAKATSAQVEEPTTPSAGMGLGGEG